MPEENPRRRSYSTLVIGGIIVIFLAAGGYYAWTLYGAPEAPAPQPETPVVDATTYASSTLHVSLRYPRDYTINESFSNTSVNPNKPISGVKFTIPAHMATGTNLSAESGVSIEQLPRAKNCTGDIYLAANVRPTKLTEGNIEYSLATSSSTASGNHVEEMVYAVSSSSPCIAIRYFIHSTNIGTSTATRAFDRASLIAAFDKIRQSLVVQ